MSDEWGEFDEAALVALDAPAHVLPSVNLKPTLLQPAAPLPSAGGDAQLRMQHNREAALAGRAAAMKRKSPHVGGCAGGAKRRSPPRSLRIWNNFAQPLAMLL